MSNKKTIFGWALYDWANSVYALAITTAIFPSYYNQVSKDISNSEISIVNFLGFEVSSISLFSYAISFSYLIITIISPFLGAISDYKKDKKIFMLLFSILGGISCLLLYYFDKNNFSLGLTCFVIGSISFSGGNIFNDAMIPEISKHEHYSKISSIGFVFGYLGSVINLIICLYLILNNKVFGFTNSIQAVKYSFLIVGVWWITFSIISCSLINNTKNLVDKSKISFNEFILESLKKLYSSYLYVKNNTLLKYFLLSFFFYNMGVQTSLFMSTLYATEEIKMKSNELIILVLLIQFVAILGTYIITKISKKLNYTKILILGSIFWVFLCLYAFIIHTPFELYFLSIGIGLVMGGIQSLSRSAFSLLISDKNDLATFFSFYSIVDKLSIVLGLFIYGKFNSILQSMRLSLSVIVVFFVLSLITTIFFRKILKKSDNKLFITYLL